MNNQTNELAKIPDHLEGMQNKTIEIMATVADDMVKECDDMGDGGKAAVARHIATQIRALKSSTIPDEREKEKEEDCFIGDCFECGLEPHECHCPVLGQ